MNFRRDLLSLNRVVRGQLSPANAAEQSISVDTGCVKAELWASTSRSDPYTGVALFAGTTIQVWWERNPFSTGYRQAIREFVSVLWLLGEFPYGENQEELFRGHHWTVFNEVARKALALGVPMRVLRAGLSSFWGDNVAPLESLAASYHRPMIRCTTRAGVPFLLWGLSADSSELSPYLKPRSL